MTRSFRVRLALSTALLCGATLTAFGFGTLWLIRDVKLDNLDKTLRSAAEREAARPPHAPDWLRVESDLRASMNLGDAGDLILVVEDPSGATLYRSVHWPIALDDTNLPWPKPSAQARANGTGDAPPELLGGFWMSPARAADIEDAGGGPSRELAQAGPPPGPDRPPPPGMRPPPYGGFPPPRREPGRGPPGGTGGPGGPGDLSANPGNPGNPGNPSSGAPGYAPRDAASNQGYRSPAAQDARAPDLPSAPLSPPSPLAPSTDGASSPQRGGGGDRLSTDTGSAGNTPDPSSPSAPAMTGPDSSTGGRDRLLGRRLRPVSAALALNAGGETWRIGLASNQDLRLAFAVNERVLDDDMRSIRTAFLIAVPMALALIALGAWLISRRALRPIEKLTLAARRVTAEGLDQRISMAGEDREFVELIMMFNRMLERLDASFKQAHRFTGDAAHELQTPLAILQGQLERTIGSVELGSPIQGDLTTILDEVRRLSTISRKLLLLSQADAGQMKLHRTAFPLSEALADLVEDAQMLGQNLKITAQIEPDLSVMADGTLIRQLLHNLISNAIKYNVEGGWIHIGARKWPATIEITVANASAGIAPHQRSRIFERFHRADEAHSRRIEGVGLGLALSREIARAHGGDLFFKIENETTVRFSFVLPQ